MQHYVITFVSDFRQVSCFLRVPQFPTLIILTVKHHKPNQTKPLWFNESMTFPCYYYQQKSVVFQIRAIECSEIYETRKYKLQDYDKQVNEFLFTPVKIQQHPFRSHVPVLFILFILYFPFKNLPIFTILKPFFQKNINVKSLQKIFENAYIYHI